MSRYDYTSLDKAKRIMRSVSTDPSVQQKIKFSDSHTLPKKFSDNTGTGMLLDVDVADNYVGYERWKVHFTSPTAFTLYRGEDELTVDGSGVVSSTFISSSGIITITPSDWVGTFALDDYFSFETESNISNEDGEAFITDAEAIANSIAHELVGSDYVPYTQSIPEKINTGTAYIAAFLIWSSVYTPTNQSDIPEFVNRWYRIGSNLISAYLETIPGRLTYGAVHIPRFVARKPLFDYVGVKDAEGVGLAMGDEHGEVDAQDVEYDTFQNTLEGGN